MNWLVQVLSSGAVTAGLLIAVGWLARTWLKARLSESLRLETDITIERLRSELNAAENRIEAVTSAGIGSVAQMADATFPTKVVSIQQLWSAVLLWRSANAVTHIISAIDADYVRENGNDAGTKATFRKLLDSFNYLDLLKETNKAEEARPFVSDRAWALYYALNSFLATRVAKAALLSVVGSNAEEMWHRVDERALVAASAPADIVDAYDNNVMAGSTKFIAYLEREIISELRRNLSGEQSAPEAALQAADLVVAASNLLSAAEPPPEPPQPN